MYKFQNCLVRYFKCLIKRQYRTNINLAKIYNKIYEVFGERFTLLIQEPLQENSTHQVQTKRYMKFYKKYEIKNQISFLKFEDLFDRPPKNFLRKKIFITYKK
jgi:hypothetical protein